MFVMSKSEVVGVRKIEPAEMTVATETKIGNLDRVWSNVANQRRSHQKTVAIEFNAAPVVPTF